MIDPNGSGSHLITRDGRSLNPVWGRVGIAFDHERLRKDAEPASQVWLMASDGSRRRQLTALPFPGYGRACGRRCSPPAAAF